MLHMSRRVRAAVLIGLALGLAGCGAARKPYLVILPSYSYVRSGVVVEATAAPLRTVVSEVDFPRTEGLSGSAGKPPPGM
jgi:hypothetical protein